ncbi:DUF814 domain-containing protein [Hyphobacterium sp. CCMP332]|nr:DUF814 domain-containing protein [Hyphobacterium sp. CCMP332]
MWNYFTIKWLSEILIKRLHSLKIGEVFTQNKNEIIIGFYQKEAQDFYWILNFDPSFPHMRFLNDYNRAKRNSLDLFPEIIDVKIVAINMHMGERSFHFELDNKTQLIFKLHAGRSNLILKEADKTTLFRTDIKKDYAFKIPDGKFYGLPNEKIETLKSLKAAYPILDKIAISHLMDQNFFEASLDSQHRILNDLLSKLEEKKIYLFQQNATWHLHQLKLQNEAREFSDLLEAVNTYSGLESKNRFVNQHKSQILKELRAKGSKLSKSLGKMNNRLNRLQNNNDWEEEANLIMANLHLFNDGKDVAEVFDFYNERNKALKIKKGMSAQKYAESLYKKSKNKSIEIRNLEKSIEKNNAELEKIESHINEIQNLDNPKLIREWLKKRSPKSNGNSSNEGSKFKEFKIKDFVIYVGKNAKNNDELTTKFAKKNDIWMHAKDVSGSHLIIRKDKNTKIPSDVLEQAASIAAWYSKGKNDTLFPVIYTERKYVRKGKGLASGQVFVDKYDVLIVKPGLP